MIDKWRSWSNFIDSKVDPSSRWHSGHRELVRTPDRIGDFLVAQLRSSCQGSKEKEIVAEWGRDLFQLLQEYEEQSRLGLVKLASSGRVLLELERGTKATLDILGIVDADVEASWAQELQRERDERVKWFQELLHDDGQFALDMGEDDQQLEVLTLMKYGLRKYGDVLTQREIELISAAYDAVACNANTVVGAIPDWFATSKRGWSRSDRSFIDEGEEACLRQVDTWAQLHHPHRGDDTKVVTDTVDDLNAYMLPDGVTISEILEDIGSLCNEVEDFGDFNRPVYSRLVDVHLQLAAAERPLPLMLVEDFGSILWRFFLQLEARSQGDFSVIATLCATNTIATRNYDLHHDVDRLILSSPILQNASALHYWQPTWEQTSLWQQQALEKCLENPGEFLYGIESESSRAEAMAMIKYETLNSEVDLIDEHEVLKVPRWFIPPHQIELGRHLADGSFGAVYLGKWFSTDVVVKQVLTNQSSRENREQFFHEVNLWASLNHDNLIKLYGACYEGQPFFVCERADEGTLIEYMEGRNRFPVWRALLEAAKGLQYLHERGIVHGDLKGNNILVCDGTAKLTDFGLSTFARSANPIGASGSLGAFRWKAPECLAGSRPTFASDIFSFAMCVIEAIGGEFPWGNSMDESVVKFNVLQKRMIPPRPNGFDDAQWDLIVRMCSYEPHRRPDTTALVHMLQEIV
ncbi:unnamed protein product [Phytophthora lilii]|uniref:Unnamed protein product n=1 Tax=Phytophthora lilii TaxID=2077276 RepID=A0A9W6U615_9STRA|nr:unnamed protein product [Phytophthora lilii]